KARAEKLFGGAEVAPAATPAPAPVMAQPVAPPTVEVVSGATAPSAAAAQAEAKLEIIDETPAPNIKEELKLALQEQENLKKDKKQQVYVSAIAGMGEYPDVVNMQGTG